MPREKEREIKSCVLIKPWWIVHVRTNTASSWVPCAFFTHTRNQYNRVGGEDRINSMKWTGKETVYVDKWQECRLRVYASICVFKCKESKGLTELWVCVCVRVGRMPSRTVAVDDIFGNMLRSVCDSVCVWEHKEMYYCHPGRGGNDIS